MMHYAEHCFFPPYSLLEVWKETEEDFLKSAQS